MQIIGFAGRAGSGKTTAAKILVREFGFTRTRFADPLKDMLRAYLKHQGVAAKTIVAMLDGSLKNEPTPFLSGKSPRHCMMTLGTEWGRELVSQSFWTDAWQNRVNHLAETGIDRIVVDDVRFLNEVDAVHRQRGIIVKITGRSLMAVDANHASERDLVIFDKSISNVTTSSVFRRQIQLFMVSLTKG